MSQHNKNPQIKHCSHTHTHTKLKKNKEKKRMPVKLKFYNSLFLTFLQLNCPLVFIYTEIVYVNIETIIILTKINNTLFTVFFLMEKHKKA